MKPHLFRIQLHPEHSFNVRHDLVRHLNNQWHYHEEIELIYIIRGSGRQFIGDHVHHFKNDDMFLIGSNLPHLFRSDEQYLSGRTRQKMEAIVVHFLPDCFGPAFFQLPENRGLARILARSAQGLRIRNRTRLAVADLMRGLVDARHSERIILLLQALHCIAQSRETRPVCSKGLQFHFQSDETDRLDAIYQFTMNHFHREITLEQIAAVAHLSPHAFCRYFKTRIKKPYSRFLLEVRVGHACKLLAETARPVAEICFESGFNNFSNFNRHFRSIIGRTPSEHRKVYRHLRPPER